MTRPLNKFDHVKSAKQTRRHTCHWPNCNKQVPPAMWGCKPHWFMLPKNIRNDIWITYRAGQEIEMNPSSEYVLAAQKAQIWIEQYGEKL